ncbi:MAG TPA: flippase [Candidatus Solibacter sp.]|nr:flippase [Candidatus Solibacter sp.]
MTQKQITGRLITTNWIVNLFGQGIPLLVGLLAVPFLLRYLGLERFGILSLAWALLGYAGQFDLGLGRATTKYVAECLGRGEHSAIPGLFWTSLGSQAVFGILAGCLLALAIPVLVHKVLKISPACLAETKSLLFILALSIPLVIIGNSSRGMLEAGQHFGIINYVKIPAHISIFLLPIVAVLFRAGLRGIVLLLLGSRLLATVAYFVLCFEYFPELHLRFSIEAKLIRPLLVYGGWVTVSNLAGPLLTYMDRFFIGAILSVSALAYYTAPYEIVSRIWFIPTSLMATVFPAFSTLRAGESNKQIEDLYVRSLKSILLVSGSILLILAAFTPQVLRIWLGTEFAARSTRTMQILALGMLVNCIAFVPFGLLQGVGRPDLTAKVHLLELPLYVLALWFFLSRFGLLGAALACTFRISLDTLLLFGAVLKLKFISGRKLLQKPLQRAFVTLTLPALLVPLSWIGAPTGIYPLVSSAVMAVFVAMTWGYALDTQERTLLVTSIAGFRAKFARAK